MLPGKTLAVKANTDAASHPRTQRVSIPVALIRVDGAVGL